MSVFQTPAPRTFIDEHPGYVSGQSYYTGYATLAAAAVGAVDRVYGYLFYNPYPVTISSLNMRVATGGAASAVKVGIWRYANRCAVGVPVVAFDAGQATTASATDITMAVSGSLPAGWLYIGTKYTGTLPTMIVINTGQPFLAAWHGGTVAQTVLVANQQSLTATDAYANDIGALDLSGVTLTYAANGPPHVGFTVA